MNSLDKHYIALLEEILEYGTKKQTRNGEVLSLFGKQIRHRMREGFPLLTTKKMYWKGIVTELMWFLQGRTDLKWLLEHNNTIWLGDAIKNYEKHNGEINWGPFVTKEEAFIDKIKTDSEFAEKWGGLGRVYGVQWRKWQGWIKYKNDDGTTGFGSIWHDQIANLIQELKTNPDSRRLMVSAWNVGELDQMVLPPCHYGFQVYTRELSLSERMGGSQEKILEFYKTITEEEFNTYSLNDEKNMDMTSLLNSRNIPTRAISLMWNCTNQDVLLDLPSIIASYGLLLEIIAKMVNMVPDELIGNLGDCHIYTNQIEGVEEQISREPYPLPKLNINTEWWPTESGECGVGPIDTKAVLDGFSRDAFCKCLMEEDIQLANYKSHPKIFFPPI